jgi:hypothetical protein
MQQFSSLLSWRLFTAQHVSGVFPSIIRSSMTAVATSGFIFVSWWQSCCVRGRAGRPDRPRTQHDCQHDTKVKPEAATAVTEFLMMGGKTSETCWAVNKRQDNKLENCCIWLVIYLNWIYTMRQRLCWWWDLIHFNIKPAIQIFLVCGWYDVKRINVRHIAVGRLMWWVGYLVAEGGMQTGMDTA